MGAESARERRWERSRFASFLVRQVQFLSGNERLEEGIYSLAGKERGLQMEEILKLFNLHKVRYLVVGGQAVRLEGLPRFSMDWDVFIPPGDLDNIKKINTVLGNIKAFLSDAYALATCWTPRRRQTVPRISWISNFWRRS